MGRTILRNLPSRSLRLLVVGIDVMAHHDHSAKTTHLIRFSHILLSPRFFFPVFQISDRSSLPQALLH